MTDAAKHERGNPSGAAKPASSELASATWDLVAAPSNDLPSALVGTEQPGQIIQALQDLERAITAQSEWLKNWHLHLLSVLDPESDRHLPPPPFDFVDCFRELPHPVLRRHPAFQGMKEKLAAMRAQANHIIGELKEKGKLPTADYERLMSTVLVFNMLVRQLQNETWNLLTNIDPLTGLGNRQAMLRKLLIESDRQGRNFQPCCVALLDLDYFKEINDTLGHAAGDAVLRSIASLLAASVRPYDEVFRYGGDEFVLCLPNADARTAWAIVERLRIRVEQWSIPLKDGNRVQTTISVGVASLTSATGVDAVLDTADAALYAAKRNGRNRVCVGRAKES